jgi:CRP/FNR family cyclic AMP-dependent transcriptional regulator
LAPGSEHAPATKRSSDLIGLLVVEGLLMREIEIAGVGTAELLGSGDLIHPGDIRGSDLAPLHGQLHWSVLKEAQLAVLDARFMARVASWPEVMAAVALRAVWRTHGLAVSHAISHHARVEDRLVLLFWHFAQRWGRVRPDGVRLELPLTHGALGKLIGAQRPSITSALSRLRDRGLLRRLPDRSWLSPLPVPEEVATLVARAAARGETARDTEVAGTSEASG